MTKLECGCVFDDEGDPLELCAAHRPQDKPMRNYRCTACGQRGHNARSCGREPVRR